MSLSTRVKITCPYCNAVRTVKPPPFHRVHHCRNCGAWARNSGSDEQIAMLWYSADEEQPTQARDKALWFHTLFAQLSNDAPLPEKEHQFLPNRKFRFDASWPTYMLAVEIDGGNNLIRTGKHGQPVVVGRHTRDSDYEKHNLAVEYGWHVLRFSTSQLQRDPIGCIQQTERVLRLLML